MKKSILSLLLIIFVFLLAACYQPASRPNSSRECTLSLQVFVRQGRNINYAIAGQVVFKNTYSSFDGDFIEENGSSHPISFYFDGPAIHFILETEQGRIFGTGMMESSLETCSGNGGGTQSGPALGDMGDWRGEWVLEIHTIPPEEQSSESVLFYWLCTGLPLTVVAVLVLIVAINFAKIMIPFKTSHSSKSKTVKSTLQRTNPQVRPERVGSPKPVAEYLATYSADDKLFDISFQIERSSDYLGECGVVVAKTFDTKSNQATALEIWLFDSLSSETVSKILMSDFAHSQEILRSEMEQKGQALLIQPGETITLETKGLIAKAKILQVEYDSNYPNPKSVFKKVIIQIGVWENTG